MNLNKGTAYLLFSSAILCGSHGQAAPAPPPAPQTAQSAQRQTEELVLSNSNLRVRLRRDNLTFTVEDLASSETWGSDPWENSAGRIHLSGKHGEALIMNLAAASQKDIQPIGTDGTGVQISLSKFHSRMGPVRSDRNPEDVSLVLELSLAKNSPELTCRVAQLRNTSPYWTVNTVEWPLRLFPVRTVSDDGYIVFPQEQGFIIPSRFDKVGHFRYLNWVWDRIAGQAQIYSQSSMPWFGARKGQSSFLCIIETPDDVAYGVIGNDVRAPEQAPAPASAIPTAATSLYAPRISAVWPYWRSVKGELGYPRVARYIFQPKGGYVEMCKTYRGYAKKTGKFVTLKDKIAANPEVAKLIGAPNFEMMLLANHPREPQYQGLSGTVYDGYHRLLTTADQLEAIVGDLKDNLGVRNALLRLAGWGAKGYDNYRPIDEVPVNNEIGGEAKLIEAIQKAKDAGFLSGPFDNYRNLDLNSPSYDEKYIARDAEGALVPGFSSEGGHSEEICPMAAVGLIKKNVGYYQNVLKANMIYLDTIGGLALIECYDHRHPLTRTGVREQRLNIMRTATNAKFVLGVEGSPQDWNVAVVDYYDEHPIRMGIDVPLYSLVYHECAMLYHQHGDPYNYGMDNYGYVRGPWPAKFLRSLLYGDQSSWTFSNEAYWAWRETFKAINDILAPHQKHLAFDELLDHQILTPDLLVQRTKFSSGVEVTVNYGEFSRKLDDGTTIQPYGYSVRDSAPNGHSFSGHVSTQVLPDGGSTTLRSKARP